MKKLHILFLSILPALVILFCFLGFLAAPNDPEEVVITQSFLTPCAEYPLGTDQYGRCVLSRILYGGYTTLGIVLVGSAIVMTVGILLGLLLGQGKAGRNVLFESILNAVTAIPPIAYLIIFISTWGNSVSTMVVALTVSLILRMIKLVKTKTELEYSKAYVLCAVASGASRFRILLVHILPNLILHFRLLLYWPEFGRRGHRLGQHGVRRADLVWTGTGAGTLSHAVYLSVRPVVQPSGPPTGVRRANRCLK